jgi:uncharacterized protein (TIGR02001 family)
MTAVSDYSYRGISQTQRIPAFQPGITIETGPFSDQLPISAYVGMWASNVNFPGTNAWGELDASAGFRAKLLNDKLTFASAISATTTWAWCKPRSCRSTSSASSPPTTSTSPN